MAANLPFNAVLAGATSALVKANTSGVAASYLQVKNVASAIATEIGITNAGTLSPAVTTSDLQVLLQNIVAGLLDGRTPSSITNTDYAALSAAAIAAYNEVAAAITS